MHWELSDKNDSFLSICVPKENNPLGFFWLNLLSLIILAFISIKLCNPIFFFSSASNVS